MMDTLPEPQNRAKLAGLINNHIISGMIKYDDLKDGDKLSTVNGKELLVQVKNGAFFTAQEPFLQRPGT